jgi:putative ABC transport system substrate-binding protein
MFVYDPADENSRAGVRIYREAARQLGLTLVERPVRSREEAQASLARVRKDEVDGIVSTSSMSLNLPGLVLEATSQQQVATMFNAAFWVEQGALAGYGPDFYESGRQAARLVEKIFKGESPASIPVETNPRVELAVNLKVASALKVQISPVALQRANRLIE